MNFLEGITIEDLIKGGDHKFLDDGFGFCVICIQRKKKKEIEK